MQHKKEVLIITYYWPPSAGSGVQRWLKFAKYLPEYGWDPVIFTPENPDFDLKDPLLLSEIPSEMEVVKLPIWEPYDLFRKAKKEKIDQAAKIMEQEQKSMLDRMAIWMRANVLIPDPRIFWVKPAVRFLSDFLTDRGIDTVITSGPPHSMHLIGRNLKRKLGIRWLADFRDPWSSWEFLDTLAMSDWAKSRHRKLEKSVLAEADQVITISPTFQMDLRALSGREVRLITNGFDQKDLPLDFFENPIPSDEFHVVYSGIIDAIRNPIPFLEAFKNTFENQEKTVKLTFVGMVNEQTITKVKDDPWLQMHVAFAGYVSHQKVFEYYKMASALLLILTRTKNAKGNIPGKLFEYMATRRPIIALGDPEGDSAQIIRDAGAGAVFTHESAGEIQDCLLKLSSGEAISRKQTLDAYERKFLTSQLAGLLHEHADSIS